LTRTQLADLLRSHDELRAAVRIAGMEITRLQMGRKDSPVLRKLRVVLREARTVRKATASGRNTS
jgi:hypothetical protein